jgi:thiamine-phosphate pyrophosphorylase
MSKQAIIHANIHRVKEGARVLEDIARFIFRDENLFKTIRELRHALQAMPPEYQETVDLGGPNELIENNIRHNLMQIVQANSLRIQEALRVLEELSEDALSKQNMKSLRYKAYQIHQIFYKKTNVFLQHDKLTGLYLIIDTDCISLPLATIVNYINQSSVSVVQLRSKTLNKRNFLNQAIEIKNLLHPDKLFIINDHIDIALDVGSGVHVGQEDYPVDRLRQFLPAHFVMGVTCHSVAEAKAAQEAGASYISVGCLFPTQSKNNTVPVSLLELEKIRAEVDLPLSAIGGIDEAHLSAVLAKKVNMIAMISAIWRSDNPLSAMETIQENIKNKVLKS